MKVDFLIVGAGLAGCTLAERIATRLSKKVLLVEKRNHVGGVRTPNSREELTTIVQ